MWDTRNSVKLCSFLAGLRTVVFFPQRLGEATRCGRHHWGQWASSRLLKIRSSSRAEGRIERLLNGSNAERYAHFYWLYAQCRLNLDPATNKQQPRPGMLSGFFSWMRGGRQQVGSFVPKAPLHGTLRTSGNRIWHLPPARFAGNNGCAFLW